MRIPNALEGAPETYLFGPAESPVATRSDESDQSIRIAKAKPIPGDHFCETCRELPTTDRAWVLPFVENGGVSGALLKAQVAFDTTAKYILNFGSNAFEAHQGHIPFATRIQNGRFKNGAKLVTFDVRLSNTAGASDEWFAPFPGTDGAIALAMGQVIMAENLHEVVFHFDPITELLFEFVDAYLGYVGPDTKNVGKMLDLDLVHGEYSE